MEYEELVRERRSIRGYKPDPVPKELILEIIEVASGAPSSMNTQPWHFHVVTGEPLDRIRAGNTELMMAGAKPQREIPVEGNYDGVHRERQVEIAYQLFDAMGITDDRAMRKDWMMRGFRQFDAPVSIVVTYDRDLQLATVGHFDLGAVTYGLVLAAWDRGSRHGDQRPGHHAVSGRAGARQHPRRRGDHDLRGDGLAQRGVRGQRGEGPSGARRGSRHLRRLRRLTVGQLGLDAPQVSSIPP